MVKGFLRNGYFFHKAKWTFLLMGSGLFFLLQLRLKVKDDILIYETKKLIVYCVNMT